MVPGQNRLCGLDPVSPGALRAVEGERPTLSALIEIIYLGLAIFSTKAKLMCPFGPGERVVMCPVMSLRPESTVGPIGSKPLLLALSPNWLLLRRY